MKWFWYSLIGFCVLMCSCKTQKYAHLINEVSKENIQTELSSFKALIETSSALKIEIDQSKLRITETIKITEYDKESGKPIKETHAKRGITQDSDKVSTEEESQSVTNSNGLKLEHFREATKKVNSEVKEESRSDLGMFWEQFGKGLGIIVGIALVVGLIWLYLKKKLSS